MSSQKLHVTHRQGYQTILPNNRVALRTPSDNQDYHAVLLTIYLYINSSSINSEGPYLPSRGLKKYVRPRLLATFPNKQKTKGSRARGNGIPRPDLEKERT